MQNRAGKLIGITTYQENTEGKFDLPAVYVESVRRAGASVVLIPPGLGLDIEPILARIDALVLSGGGDIEPEQYGGQHHDTVYNLFPERDESELKIAQWALDKRLPTLAICRGLQIVNVACGGSLHVHVPDVYGDSVDHRVAPRDAVDHVHYIEASSRLCTILGDTEVVAKSWHHQAVARVADGFKVVASAADGCIEAIENESRPELVAVQWHPEMTAAESEPQQRLFDELVKMAEG